MLCSQYTPYSVGEVCVRLSLLCSCDLLALVVVVLVVCEIISQLSDLCYFFHAVPDSLYLIESLQRVNVSHNSIKELSTLIG